jgi:hypothetical protein
MIQAVDAAALAALERQRSELTHVLSRLRRAQRELVPPPATFWRGTARHAYDAAIDGVALTVEASIAAVESARDRTATAISAMGDRG